MDEVIGILAKNFAEGTEYFKVKLISLSVFGRKKPVLLSFNGHNLHCNMCDVDFHGDPVKRSNNIHNDEYWHCYAMFL